MKTINIVKGLQLKEVGTKIRLTFKGDIVSEWENNILNKYSLENSAKLFKETTIKKYFKEAYATQVGGVGDLRTLSIWAKDDSGCNYRKSIDILIDSFNAKFVEV